MWLTIRILGVCVKLVAGQVWREGCEGKIWFSRDRSRCLVKAPWSARNENKGGMHSDRVQRKNPSGRKDDEEPEQGGGHGKTYISHTLNDKPL